MEWVPGHGLFLSEQNPCRSCFQKLPDFTFVKNNFITSTEFAKLVV
jgi:hypothetical protein